MMKLVALAAMLGSAQAQFTVGACLAAVLLVALTLQ